MVRRTQPTRTSRRPTLRYTPAMSSLLQRPSSHSTTPPNKPTTPLNHDKPNRRVFESPASSESPSPDKAPRKKLTITLKFHYKSSRWVEIAASESPPSPPPPPPTPPQLHGTATPLTEKIKSLNHQMRGYGLQLVPVSVAKDHHHQQQQQQQRENSQSEKVRGGHGRQQYVLAASEGWSADRAAVLDRLRWGAGDALTLRREKEGCGEEDEEG